MTQKIHPTAILDDNAVIGANVEIGPYCVVGGNVELGDNVVLKSHVVVEGHTTIGAGTKIYQFASIGAPPQDLKFGGEVSYLKIGRNNVIREYATMNPGTESGGLETIVGDGNLFMIGAHVAHDCRIGSNVILANNANLGGHVVIEDNAILGGMSAVHQYVRIGKFAMIGGMSAVDSDIIPYGRVRGERAFLAGLNLVGLERHGFSKDQIRTLQKAFNELFAADGSTMEKRIEDVAESFAGEDAVQEIIAFARQKTKFPLCQPQTRAA